MKRRYWVSMVVMAVGLTLSLMQAAAAPQMSDFTFRVDANGGAVITGYTGLGGEIEIPSQIDSYPVQGIGKEAFYQNGKIISVILPEGLIKIEASAFQGAYNLTRIQFPTTLRLIESSAFNSCGKLKNVSIPQGIASIPESAFFRCMQLEEVTLPTGISSIGSKAFAVTGIKKISLPDGVESIGDHAFYGNRYLEEITLPSTVKNIEEYAFFVCDSLKRAVLPSSLQSMSAGVFDKCPSLETIAIPMTVKNIRPDALFSGKLRPQRLTIVSPSGSAAEKYALQSGISFEPTVSTAEVSIILNGQVINNQKWAIDLSNNEKFLDVQASTSPETLWPGVIWQSSNSKIATVDASGHVTANKKGEATITAIAADGSGAQSSFILNIANLAKNITINGANHLYSQGKMKLKAIVLPETADNRTVDWTSSDLSVASITKNGQVKAEPVTSKKTVNLIAAARDGSGITAMHELTVYPLVEGVRILKDGRQLENKSTLSIDLANDTKTIQLQVDNYPSDAMQRMKWESSSKRVAQVDDNGLITGLKKGKAVITASTIDGTRKKIAVNVEVSTLAKDIMISGDNNVAAGQKLKLTAVVLPDETTDKKVVWSSSDENVIRVNKNSGEVSAQKVETQQNAVITAAARDGSGKQAQIEITVYPSATEVNILRDGTVLENKTLLTVNMSEVNEIQLSASVVPMDALQNIKWKSSDERVAQVDDTGKVVLLRRGNVKITAMAADGSKVRSAIEIAVSK